MLHIKKARTCQTKTVSRGSFNSLTSGPPFFIVCPANRSQPGAPHLPWRTHVKTSGKTALLFMLYLSQGLPFGFQATALPVLLRERGGYSSNIPN